jgi:hypothetical protein
MKTLALIETAQAMVAGGKGLLAMDESNPPRPAVAAVIFLRARHPASGPGYLDWPG